MEQWDPEHLGRDIGYVPQAIELFEGTIADNIARFDPEATSEKVIAAAKAADVHDIIVSLAEGYGFVLGGANGGGLSGARSSASLLLARSTTIPS
ncbi:hypothetical protein [Novosphingobium panipatense]|uniref:hypothetical protein n=1 Tax=Novosphingobium panipatense TaxID=428991 RepID=UPI00361FD2CD